MRAISINMMCPHEMFELLDVTFYGKQEMYYRGPGGLRFSFSVKNSLSEDLTGVENRPTMFLKVWLFSLIFPQMQQVPHGFQSDNIHHLLFKHIILR